MKKRVVALIMSFIMMGSGALADAMQVRAAEDADAFASVEASLESEQEVSEEPEDDREEILTGCAGDETSEGDEVNSGEADIDDKETPEIVKEYKVTLDAGKGYFELSEADGLLDLREFDEYVEKADEKDLSKIEIFALEKGLYKDAYIQAEDEKIFFEKLPKPVRDGYSFLCWYMEEDPVEIIFEDKIIDDDTEVIPEDDRIFYALWEKDADEEDKEDAASTGSEDMSAEGASDLANAGASDEAAIGSSTEDAADAASSETSADASIEASSGASDESAEAASDAAALASSGMEGNELLEIKEQSGTHVFAASKAISIRSGDGFSFELVSDEHDEDGLPIYAFTKGGTRPVVVVKYEDSVLQEGKDYTLSLSNNKTAGGKKTPTVTIKGKGKFKDSRTYKFLIRKGNLEVIGNEGPGGKSKVAAADKVYAYKKGNYKTSVSIYDTDGKKLAAGKDYEKTFSYFYKYDTKLLDGRDKYAGEEAFPEDIVPADTTMLVKIVGKGNYQGAATGEYRLVTANIAKASVSIPNQVYAGTPVTLDVSQIQVKLGGRFLTEDDFEIVEGSYAGNDKKGKAKVTIRGIGDYGGSKTVTFTIENKPATYTVYFYGNGATAGKMKKQTIADGVSKELSPIKFTRKGYGFFKNTEGKAVVWNTAADGSGTAYIDKQAVTGTAGEILTLYAQWAPEDYTITYHTNGVDIDLSTYKKTYKPSDAEYAVPTPDTAVWPIGYQFGGWYKDSAYKTKSKVIKKGTTGNLNLYAKWVPYTYKIVFDGNGSTSGSMPSAAFSYGVSKKLPANKFKKTGSSLIGWSLNKDWTKESGDKLFADKEALSGILKRNGEGKIVLDNFPNEYDDIDFDLEFKLYAIWSSDFDITYDKEGAEWDFPAGAEPVRTYSCGSKKTLTSPARKGYTFGGWYTDAACKKAFKSITAKTTGNLHLYPKWTPYKITFIYKGNGNTGGKMKNQALTYAQTTEKLSRNLFVKKGGEFKGWNTVATPDGEHPGVSISFAYGHFEDKTIAAFADAALGEQLKNNAKITVYAQWGDYEYTVKFDANGGNAMDDIKYTYGEEKALETPVKAGDEFLGWYLDAAFKKKIDKITKDTYGDLELHARWKNGDQAGYTISFDADKPLENLTVTGKMKNQAMKYNVAKNLTANSFKIKGYSFMGWSVFSASQRAAAKEANDGFEFTLYENKEAVTGLATPDIAGAKEDPKSYRDKVTLYAVWEKDAYTVTLNNVNTEDFADVPEGGNFTYGVDQQIILAGPKTADTTHGYIGINETDEEKKGEIRYLAEPYRFGDTFLGWYTDAKFKKKAGNIKKGTTGNKVFYAKWATTRYTINYDLNLEVLQKGAAGEVTAQLVTDKAGFVTNNDGRYEGGYVLPTATTTKAGWGFGGWYKDKKCKKAAGNIIASPYVDMTLYAKWVPARFTIKFDKNNDAATGLTMSMQGLAYDRVYHLSKNGYICEGYEVTSWNTLKNPTAENPGISFAAKVVNEDGDYVDKTEPIKGDDLYGKSASLFEGGAFEKDGSPLTLYAQWELATYKIVYHSKYGEYNPENPKFYTAEDTVHTLAAPLPAATDRADMEFKGWYRDKKMTQPVEDPAISEGTTGTVHFYAKWFYDIDYIDAVVEYGIDTTGSEDATKKINQAIEDAYEGSIKNVYLSAGTFKLSVSQGRTKCALKLEPGVSLYLDDAAELVLTPEASSVYKGDSAAIRLDERDNMHIYGGKLTGAGTESTSVDIYGIAIQGCNNVSVTGMEISGFQCDGIYIATKHYSSDYTLNKGNNNVDIINCEIHNNRRNNITVTDADNLSIIGCDIYSVRDRQPAACICFEPNEDCSGDGICKDILIKDTTMNTKKDKYDWHYRTFYTYLRPKCRGKYAVENVTIEKCKLTGYYGNYNGKNVKLIDTTIDGEKDG
ncbi:MAG: InlB B-repeat-containing protein [Butyrivibrio sp.]|nr:InlB B-repeat-containing protein [Butyrivibrio sp.]